MAEKTPQMRVFKIQGRGGGWGCCCWNKASGGRRTGRRKGQGQLRTTLMRPAKRLLGGNRQSLLVARVSLFRQTTLIETGHLKMKTHRWRVSGLKLATISSSSNSLPADTHRRHSASSPLAVICGACWLMAPPSPFQHKQAVSNVSRLSLCSLLPAVSLPSSSLSSCFSILLLSHRHNPVTWRDVALLRAMPAQHKHWLLSYTGTKPTVLVLSLILPFIILYRRAANATNDKWIERFFTNYGTLKRGQKISVLSVLTSFKVKVRLI